MWWDIDRRPNSKEDPILKSKATLQQWYTLNLNQIQNKQKRLPGSSFTNTSLTLVQGGPVKKWKFFGVTPTGYCQL
jgi:hypothetical protein